MPVEIRETTVTPSIDGDVVQLLISDGSPAGEFSSFQLRLIVKLPEIDAPVLAQLQRAAVTIAQKHLSVERERLNRQLRVLGVDLDQGLADERP